jgi:hypothetical protein
MSMSSSFFLDVFRSRFRKEAQPHHPEGLRWYDERCPHGEPWNGVDCEDCWTEEYEIARRRALVLPVIAATIAAVLMVCALIWLPGIP